MSARSALGAPGPYRLCRAVAYGSSDIGPVRLGNEDNFLIDPDLELLAVADGMGGHDAGALASAMALETLQACLNVHGVRTPGTSADPDATSQLPAMLGLSVLCDAIASVNARLYAMNEQRQMSEGSGMGTTLTGFWRPETEGPLMVFHVGDSRLYCYRSGVLTQLTRDQTWYQQAVDAGSFDRLPARNLLLQAIGPSQHVEPEIRLHNVLPGDLLMLCSDGIHGSVPHHEISALLENVIADKLDGVCQRLIDLAVEYGGRDNATVVLVRY